MCMAKSLMARPLGHASLLGAKSRWFNPSLGDGMSSLSHLAVLGATFRASRYASNIQRDPGQCGAARREIRRQFGGFRVLGLLLPSYVVPSPFGDMGRCAWLCDACCTLLDDKTVRGLP
jgi:hypothetical protein